jgi:prevent-host-death family protein
VAETVNIHYAKTHLSKLIERAELGEEITIARAGKPVVKLAPVRVAQSRKLGFLRDIFDIPPEIFGAQLDEQVAADFESGRIFPDEDSH